MAAGKVFVDSSAFIALFNKKDRYHRKALKTFSALHEDRLMFISDYIIDEVVTFMTHRCGKSEADRALEALGKTDYLELVVIDRGMLEAAMERYTRYSFRGLSFTDVSTAVVMDAMGISDIFTFGGQFQKLGYRPIGT